MSYKLIIQRAIVFLLILLWVYTAVSKLLEFNFFRVQIYRQILPHFLRIYLPYTLPGIELSVAILLLFDRTRFAGFAASLVMMAAFTIYVGGAVFRFYDHVPCSCGGIISQMGWDAHFFFNIFFLLLTATGFIISYRERRAWQKV